MSPSPEPDSASKVLKVWEFDAVLFDLDGVITPTAGVHQQAWKETFDEVLIKTAQGDQRKYREDDYVKHIDGRPRFEGVRSLLEAHDVHLPEGAHDDPPGIKTVGAVGNMKNERFLSILEQERIVPYRGSLALMDRLRAESVPMALVSSSSNATRVLSAAGLGGAFDVVIDGVAIEDAGLRGKPHADPFLEAARRLGKNPIRCVVVEDALAGVEAGRNGNFGLVVGVAREADAGSLREAGADIVVSDLEELL